MVNETTLTRFPAGPVSADGPLHRSAQAARRAPLTPLARPALFTCFDLVLSPIGPPIQAHLTPLARLALFT